MPSQITADRIRLALTQTNKTPLTDQFSGAQASAYLGADWQFECACFDASGNLLDLSNISSVRLQVKPFGNPDSNPYLDLTVSSSSINNAMTLAQWQSGDPAQYNFIFPFANGLTGLPMAGQSQATFYFVVSALTNASPATETPLGSGLLTVIDSGFGGTTPTFVTQPLYLTAAQSDARYGGNATLLALKLNLTGGTLSGALNFSGTANSGIRVSNLTTTQRNALSGAAGMVVYDSTVPGMFCYTSSWKQLVTSVNSASGDVTFTTDGVSQGSTNLYMTNAGVIGQALTGYAAGSYSTITSADTILTALQKLGAYAAAATGSGTVTSVGLSLPTSTFTLSGTPVTTTGTLTAVFAAQSAGYAFIGPVSGGNAAPTWRLLVASDIPAIAESQVTNLTSDLSSRLLLSGGTMTGPITLYKSASGFAGVASPAQAMIAYNTTTNLPSFYNGSSWSDISTAVAGGYLPLSGGTMTGALNLTAGTPTGTNAVSASYASLTYMPLAGGTFTGGVSFSGAASVLTLPNLTSTQRTAIGSPTPGMAVYDTTFSQVFVWNGSFWQQLFSGSGNTGALPLSGGTMMGPITFSGTNYAGITLQNLTATQMNALTPATGMTIFNTTSSAIYCYTGAAWVGLLAGTNYLALSGGTMTGQMAFSGTAYAPFALNLLSGSTITGLTPSEGWVAYNGTTHALEVYNGSAWVTLGATGSGLPTTGGTMTGAIAFSGTGYAPLAFSASMTTTLRNLLSASEGMALYNHTTGLFEWYNGSAWVGAATSATVLALAGGTLTGNLAFSGTGIAGLLLNSLTTAQLAALSSPAAGSLAYNSTTGLLNYYSGAYGTFVSLPSGILANVSLTNQASNVSTTAMTTTSNNLLRRINAYMSQSNSGTAVLTLSWTDAIGTKSATISLNAANTEGSLVQVMARAAGNISYALALTGSATANVNIVVEELA